MAGRELTQQSPKKVIVYIISNIYVKHLWYLDIWEPWDPPYKQNKENGFHVNEASEGIYGTYSKMKILGVFFF